MNGNYEAILDLLKFAARQRTAFYEIFNVLGGLFRNFSLVRMTAAVTIVCEMLGCIIFDTPVTPRGEALDLTGYSLVFSDDFDGTQLDTAVWRHRAVGPRRTGYNAESQVRVYGGNLVIRGEYRNNGVYGAGWYVGAVALRQKYTRGYYEIRCKCNVGGEFWSAFWIQAERPYDHAVSQGGVGGAEIDIFETVGTSNKVPTDRNAVTSTVHCNGFDDDPDHIDSNIVGKFKVGNNIADNYNTFGVKWTESEYIFYINGVESGRTSFGSGTSQVPEEVIVSLEIPDEVTLSTDFTTAMVVDYVRIYQQ